MKLRTRIFIIFTWIFLGTNHHLNSEETNKYQQITKRNAFELVGEAPKPALPPVSEILKPNVFLTGITRFNGNQKIHLVLRKAGEPDKFVSLATNEKQYNIELKKIYKNSALVLNDGNQQLMSFENNALPTIVKKPAAPTKESSSRSRSSSRDKKDNEKDAKKSAPVARPSIVKVPSRSRKTTDPRMQQMLERGLEYVSKIEDPEKKEAMLERMEKFQRGDYDQQIKEGMKRYEEYRKSRERRK